MDEDTTAPPAAKGPWSNDYSDEETTHELRESPGLVDVTPIPDKGVKKMYSGREPRSKRKVEQEVEHMDKREVKETKKGGPINEEYIARYLEKLVDSHKET